MASYEIGAPINFTAPGPVELDLTDTTNNVKWVAKTQVPDGFKIGTPLTPDVLSMFPSGEVSMALASFRAGGNKVFLEADPALSSTYTYNFPSVPPTPGELIMDSGATNVFYQISPKNTITVRPNAGPTQFTSIAAAIASIPIFPAPGFPSATNTYLISIEDGQYSEPAITVPAYVYLQGSSPDNVIVSPSALGYSLFTLQGNNGLASMTISNGDPALPVIYVHNTNGAMVRFFQTYVTGSVKGILCLTDALATGPSKACFNYMNMVGDFQYSIWAQDTNLLGGFGTIVGLQNYSSNSHSDHCIIVDGLNTQVYSQTTTLYGDGTGVALDVRNGGNANFVGTYIKAWTTGIHTPIDTGSPYVVTAGILYENCTLNINIENVNTTGNNAGYTEYLKTIIPETSTFFIANKAAHVITVSYKGADFTSIAAAMAAITDNSALYRYTIWVFPGIYYEPPITMKSYVAIVGFFQTQCIVVATDFTQPLITGAGWAALSNITLTGSNPAFPPNTYTPSLITYQGDPMGFHFRTDNIAFNSTVNCVTIGSLNGSCIYISYDPMINMGSTITNAYVIDDTGPSHNMILVLLDGLVWDAGPTDFATLNNLISITSTLPAALAPNVYCIIEDIEVGNIFGPNNGNGIVLNGPVFATIESCVIGGFNIGVSVPPSAEFNTLLCVGNIFSQNNTDISIQNVNAFGSVIVNATIGNVNIIPGASIGIIISDPTGSLALSGNLYQGVGYSNITNISEQIQHAASVGALYQQALVTPIGGLNVSVTGGTGYISLNPPDTNLVYITWLPVPSLALPDNSFVYIFVDQTSTVQISLSQPNFVSNIILVTAKTYLGAVIYVQEISRIINNLPSVIDQTLRTVFGPIVQSGCISQPGSSLVERAVQVSSGEYALSTSTYFPNSNDNITMIGLYNNGAVEVPGITNVPLQYDNAGVLTPIPAGMWVKHSLYLLSDLLGGVQYFLIYGQELFAALITAQLGPIPLQPAYFGGNMLPSAGIIVTDSDPNAPLPANRFIDIRPTLQFKASGVTATADHNSLLNLTVGNAHPQYFRVDGTETMTGTILLGTQNILGSGGNLLNGVDITNHHARHNPGGADALAVGVPVTISTVNSLGVAASYAISDHVHAHGSQTDPTLHALATHVANGFMSFGDKIILDAATPNDVPSTLVSRDATGLSQFSFLQFLSNSSANTLTLQTSPLGFGGPNHTVSIPVPTASDTIVLNATAATLTNKTLTGNTNTIEASALQTTGAAVYTNASGPPSTGQVLTATSATTADWETPTTGTVTLINTGTGLTGGPITTTGTISLIVPVSIANGGTNSTVALNNNRIMVSSGGAIVEASALTNGQLLIGSTGTSPVAAAITGTANQVIVTNGAGAITLSLPQNIAPSSSPSFASLSLTNTTNQLVLNTGTTITLNAVTPAASIVYTIPDTGGADTFALLAATQTLTNKTLSGAIVIGSTITSNTNNVTANAIFSATTTISLGTATAPTSGQVLTALNGTSANWQTPTTGTVTSITAGTGLTGGTITTSGTIALSVPVVIANGGTNSTVALNNNRMIVSSGGSIVEGSALTNGQLFIGSTGVLPVASTLTGTANQVIVTNGAGSITLSLPQNIDPSSSPSFASETLTNTSNQLVLGTGQTITLNAPTPAASRIYTIPDVGGNDTFAFLAATQTFTNKTITSNTNNVTAASIFSATTTVNVSGATAPTIGQVLTATSNTSANWQTPTVGTVTSITAGTGLTGGTITTSGTISLSVPVVIANGGTNSTVALTNGKLMVSSGGAIVEGTSSSTPTFTSETLSATTNQLVLGTTNTTTINSVAPAASRTYTIPDAGNNDTFAFLAATQTFTNKTATSTSNNITSTGVFSATSTINLSGAAAPTTGQILTATSGTAATWQTPNVGTIAPANLATTGSLASQAWVSTVTYNATGGATGKGSFTITYSATPTIDGVALAIRKSHPHQRSKCNTDNRVAAKWSLFSLFSRWWKSPARSYI